MRSRDGQSPPALGFLTVVGHEPLGLFGGYLVLNHNGRPLEFHCTTPVKPNRAQEILYGPTLEPFLYGEQIGRALVEKSSVDVQLICTDLAAVLAVREHVSQPVALVLPPEVEERPCPPPGATASRNSLPESGLEARPTPATPAFRIDAAHVHGILPAPFSLGRNRLAIAADHADDRQRLAGVLESLAGHFDLSEPFARIRGAIDEARRGAR
ncbi:MAG TPA: hypothetical protein VMV69_08465 [Pirellulales bacterium]|nr:hypothetical protein [Pirellulales bacterium]